MTTPWARAHERRKDETHVVAVLAVAAPAATVAVTPATHAARTYHFGIDIRFEPIVDYVAAHAAQYLGGKPHTAQVQFL